MPRSGCLLVYLLIKMGLRHQLRKATPLFTPFSGCFMPIIPMRPLLEYAAQNAFGLSAFNVNNMEQIQGIMEAGSRHSQPRHPASQPRCPQLYKRHLFAPADTRSSISLSRDSNRHASRSRQWSERLHQRHSAGLHKRYDGWLFARR